jgi:hypothetical protein
MKDTRTEKSSSVFEMGMNVYTNEIIHQTIVCMYRRLMNRKVSSKSNVCSNPYWRCRKRRLHDGNKKETALLAGKQTACKMQKMPMYMR